MPIFQNPSNLRPQEDLAWVRQKLRQMEEAGIWPNGLRYLWTDAFGLLLYVSLYSVTGEKTWLSDSQELVTAVYRVLGRKQGLRIGEEPDRDGQYYHYLCKWIYALMALGNYSPGYREEAIRLAKQVHERFVVPDQGVIWKMQEDLSAPYPGFGYNALDALEGWVLYRLLGEESMPAEIEEMERLVSAHCDDLYLDIDLGLGIAMWLCHFYPREPWAIHLNRSSSQRLESLWVDPPGFFCRQADSRHSKFAFTNYGVSLGLQAQNLWPDRVEKLNGYFETYRSADEYDADAITHVMACTSRFPGLLLAGKRHKAGPGSPTSTP